MPHTPAAQALSELGVDVHRLWALIQRARTRSNADQHALAKQMVETVQAKEQAIEERRFEDAAKLRDHERKLREQVRAHSRAQLATLDELRRRLGLPTCQQTR